MREISGVAQYIIEMGTIPEIECKNCEYLKQYTAMDCTPSIQFECTLAKKNMHTASIPLWCPKINHLGGLYGLQER